MKDNVYQRIKQIIEDKGLSVRQFERLENGKYSVGLDILAVIARALDARVELISPSTIS